MGISRWQDQASAPLEILFWLPKLREAEKRKELVGRKGTDKRKGSALSRNYNSKNAVDTQLTGTHGDEEMLD